jgi:low temperature requirement protein LtrA
MSTSQETSSAAIRVSTLELFFDLVFVLVITQLTDVLADHLDLDHLVDALLVLGVTWWMYSGYAWLTNAVAPNSTTRRTLLLTGMVGFLLMGLAIPHAFAEDAWLFGVSYLVVNVVHSALFLSAGPRAVEALRRLAPLNLTAAALVLAGSFVPEPYRHLCWLAAWVLQIATPYLHRIDMHVVATGHFVERHGLVVIVAIGESIVAIGLGFREMELNLGIGAVLVAVLGLCVSYYLWWIYFATNDTRSEHVLDGITDPLRRARLALTGWGYAHYPMLLGIVILSVGVKKTAAAEFDGLKWQYAVALGGGVALYQLGHAWFLRLLGLSGVWHRVVAALVVLATVPLGHLSAIAQLAAIPIIMIGAAMIEDLPEVRRTGSTAIGDFGRTTGH